MAGGGVPKRGDVTKRIVKGVLSAVKEVTELSAEQLNANVRAFKERQASLRASAVARRREKPRRMAIAKKQGRGLPKRGDVKKRIGKELVETPVKKLINVVQNRNESEVMELFMGKSIPNKDRQLHSEMSMYPSRANSPVLEIGLSSTSRNGVSHELIEEPMQGISYTGDLPVKNDSVAFSTALSATSSLAADSFLQASPFPTKKEVVANQWPKVDMSRALVHKGSVLYEEQRGKWAVIGSCSDEAARTVIPRITPSLRVATPL